MTKTTPDPIHRIRQRIRDDALAEGFGEVAFTPAKTNPILEERMEAFLAQGHHASMEWMVESKARRVSPTAMWDQAKTAIVLVMNYGPDHDPMDNLNAKDGGNISVYARGRDYHDVIKGKLKQIAGRIASREGVSVKVFVDTAPLMEKPLAAAAGLGWQGKHTNLVSRAFGSWLFLGVILTDADWADDDIHHDDHCGTCTQCLDICPTKAFPAPYQLDARRCISYLTIEHDGLIDEEFRAPMGNRIFGCDDCLAVCPWNRFASLGQELKLQAKDALTLPPLTELLALDEDGFKKRFAGTPVRRAGVINFKRNVLIAIGNSNNPHYISALKGYLHHDNEVIKATAIWAIKRLASPSEFAALREQHHSMQESEAIQQEWQAE